VGKGRSRRFLLDRVDLGDGKSVRAWVVIDRDGAMVYKFGSPKKWWVPIVEVAGLIARRGQVRAASALMASSGLMGSKLETDTDDE